eukprot:2314437-Pleurochrysis_carterae.AAC.1
MPESCWSACSETTSASSLRKRGSASAAHPLLPPDEDASFASEARLDSSSANSTSTSEGAPPAEVEPPAAVFAWPAGRLATSLT